MLNQAAPGQNLNRVVPSKGKVVVSYDFTKTKHGHVTDKSGNHFEGSAKNVKFSDSGATFEGSSKSYITTPIGSMGPPYTLSFTVNPSSLSGVLFSGTDSVLLANDLTWNVTGQLYSLNYSLPLHKATKVKIQATREFTYAYIDQEKTPRYWYTVLDIWGDYMQTANMSFAAPIQKIGAGFKGTISNVQLSQGA